MSKRKTAPAVIDPADGITAEELSAAGRVLRGGVQTATAPAYATASANYTIGNWGGFTRWQCNHCPFDTLESEAAIIEHVTLCHTAAPIK